MHVYHTWVCRPRATPSTSFDDQSWIPGEMLEKTMGPLGHHFTIQEIIPKMAQLICSFFAPKVPKVLEPMPSRLRLLASQGCDTEPTSKSWFRPKKKKTVVKKNGTPTISMSYPRENCLISCVIPSFQASICKMCGGFGRLLHLPRSWRRGQVSHGQVQQPHQDHHVPGHPPGPNGSEIDPPTVQKLTSRFIEIDQIHWIPWMLFC